MRGSGATRTVTVNTGSGNGTIRPDVLDNNSIIDGTSNPLGGTGVGDGNFNSGEVYTIIKSAGIDVTIGTDLMGTYNLNSGQNQVQHYAVIGGPAVIHSDNGANIAASLLQWRRFDITRDEKRAGVSQVMGIQDTRISDKYVIPYYNGTDAAVYNSVQVANYDSISTNVSITISGVLQGTYPLNPGESLNQTYYDLTDGPIVIESDNGARIIASLYELMKPTAADSVWYGQSQIMGIPWSELSDTYVFPRYNGVGAGMNANIIFAAP